MQMHSSTRKLSKSTWMSLRKQNKRLSSFACAPPKTIMATISHFWQAVEVLIPFSLKKILLIDDHVACAETDHAFLPSFNLLWSQSQQKLAKVHFAGKFCSLFRLLIKSCSAPNSAVQVKQIRCQGQICGKGTLQPPATSPPKERAWAQQRRFV